MPLDADSRADRRRAVGRTRVRPDRRTRPHRGPGGAGPRPRGSAAERQRSLAEALDAAADAELCSTLEAEGARLGEELAAAAREATELAPEQDGMAGAEAGRGRGARGPSGGPGGRRRAACGREAVAVARGQLASLEHALERDRRTLDQPGARQGATERRSAVLEGEDHELGERLAETEQAAAPAAGGPADEAAHSAAARRLEVAEEPSVRPSRSTPLPGPGRRPGAGPRQGPRGRRRRAAGRRGRRGRTLLDLVEVDAGWEEAFEAAAGASLAAVVVSGSEPARAALARLRQGGATGAVLALTERRGPGGWAGRPGRARGDRVDPRPRPSPVRRTGLPGLDAVLDTLLHGSCCATRGWSAAIDLALPAPTWWW